MESLLTFIIRWSTESHYLDSYELFYTALWLRLYLFGDSIGSSSKKHLLAHDGWSEIWEIVLLVSGDVERNPGPNCMTGIYIALIAINFTINNYCLYRRGTEPSF